jgi:hypothetical protein
LHAYILFTDVEEDSSNTPTTISHDSTTIFRRPEIDFRHSMSRKNTDDSCASTSNRENSVKGDRQPQMGENEHLSRDKGTSLEKLYSFKTMFNFVSYIFGSFHFRIQKRYVTKT